jgi:hypothetical protein
MHGREGGTLQNENLKNGGLESEAGSVHVSNDEIIKIIRDRKRDERQVQLDLQSYKVAMD